jgi:hypothetical protein
MKKLPQPKKRFLSFLTAALLFVAGVSVFCVMAFSEGKTKIYFYSTETNINNFKSLKMEFDRYLSKFGPYEFQPFSSRDVFEKQVKGKDNCLLLLSSWHYRHIHQPYGLTPALAGSRNGRKYQKKIVVADEKSADIVAGKPGLVASASSLQYTNSALNTMLKGKYSMPFKVLTVPKDIDALMSVGFGMAGLAFASENAFDELKIVNPRLSDRMKILARGEETLGLILALPKGFKGNREQTIHMIKNMSMDSDGKRRIRMLGLDGWQDLDASDRLKLES